MYTIKTNEENAIEAVFNQFSLFHYLALENHKVYTPICKLLSPESQGKIKQLEEVLKIREITDVFSQLADIITEEIRKTRPEGVYEKRVEKIKVFVQEHYRETIKIKMIGDHIGMSPNALCNFFKKHTGQCLISYINEVRLEKSISLLLGTNESITEIAYNSGFNSLNRYNNLFKRVKNISPREFRKRYEFDKVS